MQLKSYLRPRNFIILFLLLLAMNENHASVRFGPADFCAVALIEGDLPEECRGPGLTGPHLLPWKHAIVNELGKDGESYMKVAGARDISTFFVDGVLILLATLAIKPKIKQP